MLDAIVFSLGYLLVRRAANLHALVKTEVNLLHSNDIGKEFDQLLNDQASAAVPVPHPVKEIERSDLHTRHNAASLHQTVGTVRHGRNL